MPVVPDSVSVRQIAHYDIKPDNIMLTDHQRAKIIDFGLACNIRENVRSFDPEGNYGTRHYAPPDAATEAQINALAPALRLKCDVYSFGIVAVETMAPASLPSDLSSRTPEDRRAAIRKACEGFTARQRSVFLACCEERSADRPTMQTVGQTRPGHGALSCCVGRCRCSTRWISFSVSFETKPSVATEHTRAMLEQCALNLSLACCLSRLAGAV